MKLYYTPTSPFVRKVMVAAHELGLRERLQTVFLRPSPIEADPTLSADNPLNKIPVLVLDDGKALYDSAVICDYLDTLHDGPPLVPARGPARFDVLRQVALCDGILEAAVLVFYEETFRPKELRFAPWTDGQAAKARRGLDALEREVDALDPRAAHIHLGHVAIGVMFGWLEFRKPLGDVRATRPRLARFYDALVDRPSMQATLPSL